MYLLCFIFVDTAFLLCGADVCPTKNVFTFIRVCAVSGKPGKEVMELKKISISRNFWEIRKMPNKISVSNNIVGVHVPMNVMKVYFHDCHIPVKDDCNSDDERMSRDCFECIK